MSDEKHNSLPKSPERHTFQRQQYEERLRLNPDDKAAQDMLDFFESLEIETVSKEQDPEWQKDNLEYDLRSSQVIIDKVKGDQVYAQNLYASMCNNEFQKNDVWPILQGKTWGCSWRYAGGIVADICETGDYIDWYCSGIRGTDDLTDEQFNQLDYEAKEYYIRSKSFVSEGTITDEIRNDLFVLGWKPAGTTNEF